MKIFLHCREPGTMRWGPNETREMDFQRLPEVGEYFALEADGDWYEVQLVIHTPFEEGLAGELYAVRVDDEEVTRQAFADYHGSTRQDRG